jgi:hypothetical protein
MGETAQKPAGASVCGQAHIAALTGCGTLRTCGSSGWSPGPTLTIVGFSTDPTARDGFGPFTRI